MDGATSIIGYGRIGRALEQIAARGGRRVLTWDAAPDLTTTAPCLEDAARAANLVIFAVPSWSVRAVAVRVARVIRPGAVAVSFAKGIEPGSGEFQDEVLRAAIPNAEWGIAGGPMLAEELLRGKPGYLVLGAEGRGVAALVRQLFDDSCVRVTVTKDVRGVAVGGALKNMYATLVGIAQGLEMGSNVTGALIQAAHAELVDVGAALGGKRQTLEGFAGTGDFLATVVSADSRNRRAGYRIARGEASVSAGSAANMLGEGCNSLVPFVERLTKEGIGMPPCIAAVCEIVLRGARSAPTIESLVRNIPLA